MARSIGRSLKRVFRPGSIRTGRKFTYSPSFLRSATLMLWWPPAMGVAVGPLRPTRVASSEAKTSSGINWPCSASALMPACTRSHSISTPVASIARTVASATSGPMPSPGIKVTRWIIIVIIEVGTQVIPDWATERGEMVERQLRRHGIRDERVLNAMREIPREEFVPPESRVMAYGSHPSQIGYGQTFSQPYMTALMAEVLHLRGDETVLEIGAGCGYAAAVLGKLAARVVTVELIPALAHMAQENLRRTGNAANVTVVEGDGSLGYAPMAPYQAISVAAGAPEVPASLLEQLADPGCLTIPVGDQSDQELRVGSKGGWRL